jgi:hypothetical protein
MHGKVTLAYARFRHQKQRHMTGGLGLHQLTQLLRPWDVSRCALAMSNYADHCGYRGVCAGSTHWFS